MERMAEQSTAPAELARETVRAWMRWMTEVERRRGPQTEEDDLVSA